MHPETERGNYIKEEIRRDLEAGRVDHVVTRFPPEPNGYLHIGSAYAINISWSMTQAFNGKFNLRMDDTNTAKEDMHYVEAIVADVDWLGVDYGGEPVFGSDYFPQLFDYAVDLIKKGRAFVCDLSGDQLREYRGTLTSPGTNSPFRQRSIEENLDLFLRMRDGEFPNGAKTLRAKIDMTSPNMNLRDPVLYRIVKHHHYRSGDEWCVYPMYDYAHPLQDYIEGVTHSLCSNEFVNNRPLYEWVLNSLDLPGNIPRQIEFGRLNITGVVTSKRYLRTLVAEGVVSGWDDPRLPTLKGMRRRGYTTEAIFGFLQEIGIPKWEATVDVAMLEYFVRQDLQDKVPCVMTVLDPLKVVITNKDDVEMLEIENHPKDESFGTRQVPFGPEIYIERADFAENPPKKFKRLSPGVEVRLKGGYFIRCDDVIKDANGEVVELRCSYDPDTKSGAGFDGRKPKGTIHWVEASEAVPCEVRLYEPMFSEQPDEEKLLETLNPDSLQVMANALTEPGTKEMLAAGKNQMQFLRNGYFIEDTDSTADKLVFTRTVSLRSSYKPSKS